ncbi:MAG: hypothetical protein Ta2E_10830 [Mycoplasmoidaceae bacterium]|nr:MAG: hypothetical protein Ta2E_10830 [Mycoplasmoidaceae bacterium]
MRKIEETMKNQLQRINEGITSEEIYWEGFREREKIRRSEEVLINIVGTIILDNVVLDEFKRIKKEKKIQIRRTIMTMTDRFGDRMVMKNEVVKDLKEGNIRISERGSPIGGVFDKILEGKFMRKRRKEQKTC